MDTTTFSNTSGAVVENDGPPPPSSKPRQGSLASATSTSSTLAHDGEASSYHHDMARASTQGSERTWAPSTTDQADNRGGVLGKTNSADQGSVTESMPWYREVLFVGTICLSQLFTQAGVGQVLSIVHVIGATWGLENSPNLSWVLAGYSLTVGTFILFSGRLGDTFGYKPLFLLGLSWYAFWTMVCGLAVYSNHVLFIFARVLQGVGPALMLPNGLAILGVMYPPGKKKAMALAAFTSCAPTGAVLGSLFSSLFALAWWPWTFWCAAPVLAATVVLAYLVLPNVTHPAQQRPRTLREVLVLLDVPGAVLGVTGLVLFNFAWNQAPLDGWYKSYVDLTLVLGLLFIAAFFVLEIRYATHPLLPFAALSTDVAFVLGAIACGWGSFGIWVWYSWQFQMQLQGASPLHASSQWVPVIVVGSAAAWIVALMLPRLGPPVVMTGALLAFLVGLVLMATCPVHQTYWGQMFMSFIVTPFGMDMSFPAGTLLLSNAVAREHQGIAASLVATIVNYSIALGLGFAGTVEYRVNNGGATPDDMLRGFRGAFYLGIGLAGLGCLICFVFLFKSRRKNGSKQPAAAGDKA